MRGAEVCSIAPRDRPHDEKKPKFPRVIDLNGRWAIGTKSPTTHKRGRTFNYDPQRWG